MDENGLLDTAAEWGIQLVQFGDNLPLAEVGSARIDELGKRADRLGIAIEVGARKLIAENLNAYARAARAVKAATLRFVIDAPDYEPSPDQVVAILRAAVPELGDGPTIALENHDRFPAETMREIVDAVGDDRVGICLDTANSYAAGEGWREVTSVLAPYTVCLHIKDFGLERLSHQMGFTLTGRPAGQGLLNVPELIARVDAHGVCRSAVVELWTPPEASLEQTLAKERAWAYQSVAYLRTLLPGN